MTSALLLNTGSFPQFRNVPKDFAILHHLAIMHFFGDRSDAASSAFKPLVSQVGVRCCSRRGLIVA
jgi:hypothetical protein